MQFDRDRGYFLPHGSVTGHHRRKVGRFWFLKGIIVLGLLFAVPSMAAYTGNSAPGNTGSPGNPHIQGPWQAEGTNLGGTSRYVRGEWIYTDYVYDDSDQLNNTADIVEFRLCEAGGDLLARITLNSLSGPAPIALAVTVEDKGGSARDWPFNAGVRSNWNRFFLVTLESVTAVDADGESQTLAAPSIDFDAGTIDFRLPATSRGSGPVRLIVASGEWQGDGFVRIIDLAFNSREREVMGANWRNIAQNAAIADGDISLFYADVNLLNLRRGITCDPISEPGYYNRIYQSIQALGGGYGSTFPKYKGRWQPYGLWIPEGYDPSEPAPLLLVLHALGETHNMYAAMGTYPQIADGLGAIAVTPLALGTDGWYWDEALVDTLDAWVDADRNYNVDRSRVYSSGYSMGGYGTYRLTTLFPELFAGAVTWVGPPAHTYWWPPFQPTPSGPRQQAGNTSTMVENAAYVPTYIIAGSSDLLVPVASINVQANRYDELGHTYRYALHRFMGHLVYPGYNDWSREREWLHGRERVVNPSRVDLRIRPNALVTSNLPEGHQWEILGHLASLLHELGSSIDGAYWLSGITTSVTGNNIAVVDLTSGGIAERIPVVDSFEISGLTGVWPTYALKGADRSWDVADVENVLYGTLSGVLELTVDLAGAGLAVDGLELDIAVDQEVALHLLEGDVIHTVILEP